MIGSITSSLSRGARLPCAAIGLIPGETFIHLDTAARAHTRAHLRSQLPMESRSSRAP